MITLYGSMASRAHRVVWMLGELALPFEHVPTHFQDGSTKAAAFLAINPNGRVPALDDNGFYLFESLAINLYLAKKYGVKNLSANDIGPQTLSEDALAMQWSFWVATEIEKPLLLAAANKMLFAEQSRNADEAQLAIEKLNRPLKVLDAHLKNQMQQAGAFVMSERFTVADLNIATVMDLAPQAGIALDAWPHVAAWHKACLERPAAKDWKDVTFSIPRPATTLGMLRMFV